MLNTRSPLTESSWGTLARIAAKSAQSEFFAIAPGECFCSDVFLFTLQQIDQAGLAYDVRFQH
jgi:hypothetical protein